MAAWRGLRLLGDVVKAYYAAFLCDVVWICVCVGACAGSDLGECRLENLRLCGVVVVVHERWGIGGGAMGVLEG